MFSIAHAGHWALGLFQAAPVVIVAAVATWRTIAGRRASGSLGEARTPHP
jgi:hypothetical protein